MYETGALSCICGLPLGNALEGTFLSHRADSEIMDNTALVLQGVNRQIKFHHVTFDV